MKLFFVGGTYRPGDDLEPPPTLKAMAASMQPLGAELARAGHELALCSPYEGSVDLEIMRGAALCGADPTIEIHYPNTAEIRSAVHSRGSELGLRTFREFTHAPMEGEGEKAARYAWLLAQLGALETSHVVIAAGGNPAGSANMLLHVAAARRKLILPFGHLGGAALRALDRLRYELDDRLGELKAWLDDPHPPARAAEVLNRLTGSSLALAGGGGPPARFFLSYARDRPAEADLVENTLRRRNQTLFRDEHAFGAGKDLPGEIRAHIHKSDVFIALWGREYACSPWCFDELELALQRQEAQALEIWLLDLDGTRIVPPKARNLINYPCRTREAIEARLVDLLELRAQERVST